MQLAGRHRRAGCIVSKFLLIQLSSFLTPCVFKHYKCNQIHKKMTISQRNFQLVGLQDQKLKFLILFVKQAFLGFCEMKAFLF